MILKLGFTAFFVGKPDSANFNTFIDGFEHIIHSQRCDSCTMHRLHFDTCAINGMDFHLDMGNGWQSGITSDVFFIASNPAARLISKISPFGTCLSSIAVMVSGRLTVSVACAVALRRVNILWVISFIGGNWKPRALMQGH